MEPSNYRRDPKGHGLNHRKQSVHISPRQLYWITTKFNVRKKQKMKKNTNHMSMSCVRFTRSPRRTDGISKDWRQKRICRDLTVPFDPSLPPVSPAMEVVFCSLFPAEVATNTSKTLHPVELNWFLFVPKTNCENTLPDLSKKECYSFQPQNVC